MTLQCRLWTLQDLRTASSYKISLDPGDKLLDVASLVATAPLHDYLPKAGSTYLSMAAEPKGHMYILSFTGDGSSPEDYQLDIYPAERAVADAHDRAERRQDRGRHVAEPVHAQLRGPRGTRCPHRAVRQHMGTQLAPRGALGGVRQYLGRMDIDLPGFSRCKFPSEYALSAETGQARSVNLGEGDLLPHLDARFAT